MTLTSILKQLASVTIESAIYKNLESSRRSYVESDDEGSESAGQQKKKRQKKVKVNPKAETTKDDDGG